MSLQILRSQGPKSSGTSGTRQLNGRRSARELPGLRKEQQMSNRLGTCVRELRNAARRLIESGAHHLKGLVALLSIAVMVTASGTALIPEDHPADFEERFALSLALAPGTSVRLTPDGGLDQVDAIGSVVGRIEPAMAVDSEGALHPAAYRFDQATHELVLDADTSGAVGSVPIDRFSWSWKVLIASLIGLRALAESWDRGGRRCARRSRVV